MKKKTGKRLVLNRETLKTIDINGGASIAICDDSGNPTITVCSVAGCSVLCQTFVCMIVY